MPMNLEDLKQAIKRHDIEMIDTPEMTALIEGMNINQVEALHGDNDFVTGVMAGRSMCCAINWLRASSNAANS